MINRLTALMQRRVPSWRSTWNRHGQTPERAELVSSPALSRSGRITLCSDGSVFQWFQLVAWFGSFKHWLGGTLVRFSRWSAPKVDGRGHTLPAQTCVIPQKNKRLQINWSQFGSRLARSCQGESEFIFSSAAENLIDYLTTILAPWWVVFSQGSRPLVPLKLIHLQITQV